jgi:environmental stress-induced protein Ves
MFVLEPLGPEHHRRLPWKNGRGELVLIDGEGTGSWQDMGVAWHFGRTAIVEEGPCSDYTGYERLQVVIKGDGLVLIAPDHEIDLREPLQPRRYDGGTPIRTRLERGPVEVVNLIADREKFDIELRVGKMGAPLPCKSGRHVVYAPDGAAQIEIGGRTSTLPGGHALRVQTDSETSIVVLDGHVIVGSIHNKP